MQLFDLEGRKILVTGASSGIGRSVAVLASRMGASLVLCARDQQRLEETKKMLYDQEKHICLPFDVKIFDAYEDVFGQAVSDGTKLDGLVHCAGIAPVIPLRAMKLSAITETMETNFTSFMYLMAMFAKRKYSNGGSVVAISAANVHYPQKCMSVYAASKAALEAAVKTLALELAAQNIRINCVIPGATNTSMMGDLNEDSKKAIEARQLLGVAEPEDVANMITFLLSDASSMVTGRSMFVDGGMLGY